MHMFYDKMLLQLLYFLTATNIYEYIYMNSYEHKVWIT